MKDNRKSENENEENKLPETRKVWFWVGVGLTIAALVAFGLTFSLLRIYALISSILLSMAALAFFRTQKKRNNFTAVFALTICAYVVLGVGIALFIGGLIYSAV